MKKLAPLFLFLLMGGPHAFGFEMSGHDLLAQLEDYYIEKGMTEKQLLNAGRGYGYISAVFDSHREDFTIPTDIKPTHIVATVYKFLIDNPNLKYKNAHILIQQAITEAYPLNTEQEEK